MNRKTGENGISPRLYKNKRRRKNADVHSKYLNTFSNLVEHVSKLQIEKSDNV